MAWALMVEGIGALRCYVAALTGGLKAGTCVAVQHSCRKLGD
jgi:hypothetical protein